MSVWSFCPRQIQETLFKINIKNKGDARDIVEYRSLWVNWIKDFKGCESKRQWAISNGIHDAIINQVAYRSRRVDTFYIFENDYKFYHSIGDNTAILLTDIIDFRTQDAQEYNGNDGLY